MISFVIPTRGDTHNIQTLLSCFKKQTYQDFEVIFVVDQQLVHDQKEYQDEVNIRYITHLNTHFVPHQGASYVRNFGIHQAKGDMINLMDDDEFFEADYVEKSIVMRKSLRKNMHKDFVLVPTLMYRKTGQIQSQGFSHFNYFLSRPIPFLLDSQQRHAPIQMYSGNSLLAPAHVFKEIQFDEKMDFVYEDLDMTYRIHRAGYPIIVSKELQLCHMERDKTILEMARVGHPQQAYKKSKHRMMFVKKYANLCQYLGFFLLGFLGQPLRLSIKILRYGKSKEQKKLLSALRKGTRDGLFAKV